MKPISWILAAVVLAAIVAYAIHLDRRVPVPAPKATEAVATFAGGCFWCLEAVFEKQTGVSSVVSGYIGHREVVRIVFDPTVISYAELLNVFWRNIDPTDADGQFVDRGSAYTTAIFYHTTMQQHEAETSLAALARSGRFRGPIVTEIKLAGTFHPASASHQDFHRRCPLRYRTYRRFSGREEFFRRTWENHDSETVISRRESP